MGSDEKHDMKEFLPELFAKAKAGDRLDVGRLRDEIKKEIESDETMRKFLGLLETFRDIIPRERQRYNAAVRALSATAGLSLQNVLESSDNQLEKLRLLEKEALSALPGFRDDIAVMESRSQEIKREVATLHEKIAELEKEEQEVLGKMAAREKEAKIVEGAVSRIFMDVGTEITGLRKKIEEFTAEKAPVRPKAVEDSLETHEETHEEWEKEGIEEDVGMEEEQEEEEGAEEEEEGVEKKFDIEEIPAAQETEFLKKCPMCGGQIHFLIKEAKWMCYTCGHEETTKEEDEAARAASAASEPSPATVQASVDKPEKAPEEKQTPPGSSPSKASPPPLKKQVTRKKACPACRKQMEWLDKEKSWLCPSCGYRRMVF
jgi:predicted RNA-binding Zn-ribbon protein involved in translation (DUF1610 family)